MCFPLQRQINIPLVNMGDDLNFDPIQLYYRLIVNCRKTKRRDKQDK